MKTTGMEFKSYLESEDPDIWYVNNKSDYAFIDDISLCVNGNLTDCYEYLNDNDIVEIISGHIIFEDLVIDILAHFKKWKRKQSYYTVLIAVPNNINKITLKSILKEHKIKIVD